MPLYPGRLGSLRSQLNQCHPQALSRSFATCRFCRAEASAPFSKYRPEHPNYIKIPPPVQPQAIQKPIIKGKLPVPRQIFPSNASDKTEAGYLASTTREPLPQNLQKVHDDRTKEFVSFKQRQADKRRRNLRQGLTELKSRHDRNIKRMTDKSSQKQIFNRQMQTAPEPEYERLTKATVTNNNMTHDKLHISDPNREVNVARMRGNVAASQAKQEEERREMLHTLYMNAGRFITTPEQLEEAIDDAFEKNKLFTNEDGVGTNIWQLGPPLTTAQMLRKNTITSIHKRDRQEKAVNDATRSTINSRMEKLGNELTGGKA